MSKTNNNHHAPANATFPVQDNFGSVIMAPGLSKLELISAHILAPLINNPENKNLEPEIVVEYAVDIAEMLLNEVEKRLPNQSNLKLS